MIQEVPTLCFRWCPTLILNHVRFPVLSGAVLVWHQGRVTGTLAAGRADGFTHDAIFDGDRYPRGTTLTAESVDEGVLVLLRPMPDQPRRPAPTRRQPGRQAHQQH